MTTRQAEIYRREVRMFQQKHAGLIRWTNWLAPSRQARVVKFFTREPWEVVHDALYFVPVVPKYAWRLGMPFISGGELNNTKQED